MTLWICTLGWWWPLGNDTFGLYLILGNSFTATGYHFRCCQRLITSFLRHDPLKWPTAVTAFWHPAPKDKHVVEPSVPIHLPFSRSSPRRSCATRSGENNNEKGDVDNTMMDNRLGDNDMRTNSSNCFLTKDLGKSQDSQGYSWCHTEIDPSSSYLGHVLHKVDPDQCRIKPQFFQFCQTKFDANKEKVDGTSSSVTGYSTLFGIFRSSSLPLGIDCRAWLK